MFYEVENMTAGDMSVGRVDVWLKAFSMFGNHSLVGIGWGQYVNQGGWFWNIHNIYIQLLVETGIIGFIIYCGWFLFHLVRTWSMYSKMRVNPEDYTNIDYCLMNFSLAMQIFFILYGFTGNPLYDREMFHSVFFEGCCIVYNENKRRRKFKEMEREKMNLSKIHHIAIIVSDYEAAKDFYVNKLGFSVIRENYRPERKDWKLDLRVNEHTELEIFSEENPPKRVNRPEACGLRHLAFCVESVEQTVKELAEVGIKCEPIRVDDYTGKKMTFFHDPDGLPLELHE